MIAWGFNHTYVCGHQYMYLMHVQNLIYPFLSVFFSVVGEDCIPVLKCGGHKGAECQCEGKPPSVTPPLMRGSPQCYPHEGKPPLLPHPSLGEAPSVTTPLMRGSPQCCPTPQLFYSGLLRDKGSSWESMGRGLFHIS